MKQQLTLSDVICNAIKENLVGYCCWDCAEEHRQREQYDGTFTVHIGKCEICGKEKEVASAKKLFGYHKFI